MDRDVARVRRIIYSTLTDCSRCELPYTEDDFRLVGRKENLWLFCARCSSCGTQVYVAAVVGDFEADDVEVMSLEQQDSATAADAPLAPDDEPISVDDVLDMHEFLETFDGDFLSLFLRRRS